MGGSEAMQAVKVYHHLLKALDKHIGRHFRGFITQEFRKSSELSDPLAAQQKDLLFSYNIAVDRSDEMKRIVGKSAASVGLQLPDVYKP
ncbi:uncharacterized protein LOC122058097 isoform X2 [Macadamia integrifolia]|uniref:uncharacterized protein LOC122058097 isoform X2 n=1 Tax=Macadamia integrifolia TaxID=60698 RepID=UPI001C533F25|nr:uncharacterized protein LOC122058097 isoform X2 [Macadamia integrifolia]